MQVTDVDSIVIQENSLINFLFTYANENNLAIAVWQLPEKKSRLILMARNAISLTEDTVLEELSPGFILAPFDRNSRSLFIPAEFQFRLENGVLVKPVNDLESYSLNWLREHLREDTHPHFTLGNLKDEARTPETVDYLSLVKSAIEHIEAGHFEKVVPSRTRLVSLSSSFEIVTAFLRLCQAYPQAFVSLVSSSATGTWMGATPEELVRVQDKTIFQTVALAGTQPYHEGLNLKKVAWTQKEIEEQALVERYIISCFKRIRLREYDEVGPRTIVAGNLLHLKSEFTVNMKETNFPQLASTMLKLLHPTSAVCGVPLDSALKFLQDHEGYDRKFYSGFLGPVNIENQTDIFVNLRCMQLSSGKAILYAGAGVTIDSIPEQEWEETEMKMNTLLRVIHQ